MLFSCFFFSFFGGISSVCIICPYFYLGYGIVILRDGIVVVLDICFLYSFLHLEVDKIFKKYVSLSLMWVLGCCDLFLFSLQLITAPPKSQLKTFLCLIYNSFGHLGAMTCADLANYYNSCRCCIFGDIGIDKSKVHSKQIEGNYVDKNVVIRNIKMQIICDIPVMFGK